MADLEILMSEITVMDKASHMIPAVAGYYWLFSLSSHQSLSGFLHGVPYFACGCACVFYLDCIWYS
jgi:hypothetical protein